MMFIYFSENCALGASMTLNERLKLDLGFEPRKYIPCLTPSAFRSCFRGSPVYGPVPISESLPQGISIIHDRSELTEICALFFWHLDCSMDGYWSCMDSRRLFDNNGNISLFLMFSNRNDAVMMKLKSGNFYSLILEK
jgi:hypothetical protein